MRSWIVSVGPNPGRGSTHAHGPVTNTGPVRVNPTEDIVNDLVAIKTLLESQVDPSIICRAVGYMADNYRGKYDA